jgi:hypothetical protein
VPIREICEQNFPKISQQPPFKGNIADECTRNETDWYKPEPLNILLLIILVISQAAES